MTVFVMLCVSRTVRLPSITKLPAIAKSALNEASPSTTKVEDKVVAPVTPKVELIVAASETAKVELKVVALSTCRVESIVTAPPTERAVFKEASF